MHPISLASSMASRNVTRKSWFKLGQSVGNISNTYTEISGLTYAIKPQNANYLWFIDDGVTPYIVAINRFTAAIAGKWTFSGITISDTEDVTSASVKGQPYIYLCDVGDNGNARATFQIVRIKEPTITGSDGSLATGERDLITCEFPGANIPSQKDVECVMADPDTGDLYFITKRISPILCYRLKHQDSYAGTQTLEYLGAITSHTELNTITSSPQANGYVVAGCISPNGSEIMIKSYFGIFIWRRNKSAETIYQTLSRAPDSVLNESYVGGGDTASLTTAPKNLLPHGEPQGESVTFDAAGMSFYTCSELDTTRGGGPTTYPLFKYDRVHRPIFNASFQQGSGGYTGCVDTYIDQASPNMVASGSGQLVSDYDFTTYPTIQRSRHSLFKFDTSSIPTGAEVTSASFNLWIAVEGKQFDLHKMNVPWSGTSSYNTLTGGVSTGNGECSAFPEVVYGQTGAGVGFDSFTGTVRVNLPLSMAQSWISSPSTNYGFVIFGGWAEQGGDGLQFFSSEATLTGQRPRLNVSYALP